MTMTMHRLIIVCVIFTLVGESPGANRADLPSSACLSVIGERWYEEEGIFFQYEGGAPLGDDGFALLLRSRDREERIEHAGDVATQQQRGD